jgi:hypothetical protein
MQQMKQHRTMLIVSNKSPAMFDDPNRNET